MKWLLTLVLILSTIFPAYALAQCAGGRCAVGFGRPTLRSTSRRVTYYRPVRRSVVYVRRGGQYYRGRTIYIGRTAYVRGQPIRNIGRLLFGNRRVGAAPVRRSVLRRITVEHQPAVELAIVKPPVAPKPPQDLMRVAEGFHAVPMADLEFAQGAGLCPKFLDFKPVQPAPKERARWR